MDMKNIWDFHLVKREQYNKERKEERYMCSGEVCKCKWVTAFFSDGLISSCDAIQRAVFLLLVNTHARTHSI